MIPRGLTRAQLLRLLRMLQVDAEKYRHIVQWMRQDANWHALEPTHQLIAEALQRLQRAREHLEQQIATRQGPRQVVLPEGVEPSQVSGMPYGRGPGPPARDPANDNKPLGRLPRTDDTGPACFKG